MVALLLLAVAAFGGLVGLSRLPVSTWLLACAVGVLATLLFLPWVCVSAIPAAPGGEPPAGSPGLTSCETLYGDSSPELAGLGEDGTGRLLGLAGFLVGASSVVLTRRRRGGREPAGRSRDGKIF